ncbi:sialidase family protein [Planomonospora sp. ID82291]|uniref:sialidase family protein n=1 Tax=Planomonospora sp. ID82291 TaxID=2738136 RepID=UPI0018C39E52|nr:sialidase family protein [Planomonospora sp. ID82291]MBG0815656.1 exo-alpha-sialidase [Planomonospora sp. ID82291]
MTWPEIDVVGPHVGSPVTVYGKAARGPGGELAHEGNRVPDIAALDARRLVVGWRAGVPDEHDPTPTDQGTIMYGRSEDGGRTWTTGVLAAATATRRYHYVIFLNDGGTLYALLGLIRVEQDRDRTGNVDGFPTALTARRSTDAGRTWTDFPVTVDVPDNGRGVVVAGRPLRHGGLWLVPYWRHAGGTTRAGVLRSADLVTWTSGALADNPPGVAVEEPQIAVSQHDPGTLVMVTRTLDLRGGASPAERDARYRTHAAHCATATSADAGLTWSPMTLDEDLPNHYVKTFFTGDSEGRHLAIYNTFAGPFTGPSESRPEQYREVLHYKVRRPGEPWGPGRLFADGRRLTRGAARGWDVYPSADEYAPGRFFVVWEHNQTNIRVAALDITREPPGGDLLAAGWELGGAGRLSTWRVTVDGSGTARLARDGADTGARWVVQDSRERPQLTHWVTGTPGGNAAAATVEWTRLTPATPQV